MRQKEKVLILSLISFLSLNRFYLKSAPEHIIKGQSSPRPHYFYYIFVGNIAPDFQMPQNPTTFLFLYENISLDHCPGPHYIRLRLPQTPLYFIFPDQKFCPRLPRTSLDLVWGIVTLLISEMEHLEVKFQGVWNFKKSSLGGTDKIWNDPIPSP